MSNSPSRSHDAFSAPGVLQLCFANPIEGVGGAPRDVRVLARHPWGTPSCVKDARERAYDAACQAPSEAPCVPRRGTLASRRSTVASLFRSFPRKRESRSWVPAFAGTSGKRLSPRLAPHSGSSLEHALNERGGKLSSTDALRSQEKYSGCSRDADAAGWPRARYRANRKGCDRPPKQR